jgi:hypothetical protein
MQDNKKDNYFKRPAKYLANIVVSVQSGQLNMYKYKPMMDLFVCSVISFCVLRFSIQQVTSGKLGLLLAATREPDPPLLPSPVVAIEIE